MDSGHGVDLVAFDFYSRFQRPTAPSCERFAAAPGLPACKRNRLRWCHTDLGANVINYRRFIEENRRFGALGVRCWANADGGTPRGCCSSGAFPPALGVGRPRPAPALLSPWLAPPHAAPLPNLSRPCLGGCQPSTSTA